jgi:3-deoxy-D-manno-octulosonate 8-phosphate phosphatase (KDO 8-P phosphatase)
VVKLIVLDVDGVLTDGSIIYDSEGREYKIFNVKDGYGIVTAVRRGIKVVVISGRNSPIVERRCRELGITEIFQGVSDKLKVYEEVKEKYGLKDSEVAAMGDDIPDIPILERVGFSGAPADAVPEVKKVVKLVTSLPGGKGAVREFIDYLLKGGENQK